MNNLSNKQNISDFLKYLTVLIIIFGIFIRVSQYLSNRALWGDEASLALNIVNRSYLELLQPLDRNQAAPPGFLWTEKLFTQIFGNNEYSLRLFPLISGIVSLIAFYKLGKWAVSAIALPIAIILFACLRYTLYYATEVKQYSSDVMIALLLCLLLIPLLTQILNIQRILLIGILGAVAILFSHPTIFVLAGLESANLILTSNQQRKAILINRLPAYLLWLISFGSMYFLTIARVMQNNSLQNAWGDEYPNTIFDLIWLLDSFGRFFSRPLGFSTIFDGIAILAFVIGCVFFIRKKPNKFIILMSPVFATLAATYLHKYPFRGRLILFLAPFFILVIAEGIAFLLTRLNHSKQQKYFVIAGITLACLLIVPSLVRAGNFVFYPETKHEIRPIIEYIKTHQKPGDVIYIGDGGPADQFEYYAPKYGYSQSDFARGYLSEFVNADKFSEQGWQQFKNQSNQLKNKQRIWFVFPGLNKKKEPFVKLHLDRIGQKLDYFNQPGAFTYLYQMK
ncbi:glycosyltransferase family 39 protein [Floridanema evergladense]|uniref:Glycosyltransferase family 39 protein n=1 Tax=Floridaenema evergladense BLCC-F167 TaxID=3153639 RepID=A0ABV4WI44_9CYAN